MRSDNRGRSCTAPHTERGAEIMREMETQAHETSNHILFPMAVGILFIAVLVVGAFLG